MRMLSVSGVPIAAPAHSVRSDADLRTAAETMLNNKLREIQVVDTDGQVVGLLDETDISRFYLKAADEQHAKPPPHAPRPISYPPLPLAGEGRGEGKPLVRGGASYFSFSFLALNSAIMTSRACLGTSAYFWNSIVNSPLPWVTEREIGRVAEHVVQRHLGHRLHEPFLLLRRDDRAAALVDADP